MGDICKICIKDGWLFATHSFTNSNLEYPSKQRIVVNLFFSKFFNRKQGTFRSAKSNILAFSSFFIPFSADITSQCCTCSDSPFDLKTKKKSRFVQEFNPPVNLHPLFYFIRSTWYFFRVWNFKKIRVQKTGSLLFKKRRDQAAASLFE